MSTVSINKSVKVKFNPRDICSLLTFVFIRIDGSVRKFMLYAYDEPFFNEQEGCWDTKPRRLLVKVDGKYREIRRTLEYYRIPNSRYKSVLLDELI